MSYINYFEGRTLNKIVKDLSYHLINNGTRVPSRNGETWEIMDSDIILTNPQNRHLYLHGRKNNIYGTLAEIMWLLSGEDEITDYLKLFIPRVMEWSDDGKTWRGAYGPRIFLNDQLDHVLNMFIKDGPNTRRATMTIWRPDLDTISAIRAQGYEDTKDVPCSQWLGFWIRDNKLNCKFQIRSNDLIWGLSHINFTEFTIIHELLLQMLKEGDPGRYGSLQLGHFHYSVLSLHLYEKLTADQALGIISNPDNNFLCAERINYDILLPLEYHEFKKFFNLIYERYLSMVNHDEATIDVVFNTYGVPVVKNQLYNYCKLVENYIKYKNGLPYTSPPNMIINALPSDLKMAVKHNKFTPPDWLIDTN